MIKAIIIYIIAVTLLCLVMPYISRIVGVIIMLLNELDVCHG